MAVLDCSRLDAEGSELFGKELKAGLLDLIGRGTLVLSNVHQVGSFSNPQVFTNLCLLALP